MDEPQETTTDDKPLLVIVTGLSGAGMSTAIKALEDNGFYCIDNLPLEMIRSAVNLIATDSLSARGFALGMDIRDKHFAQDFMATKEELSRKLRIDIIFLNASPDVIATRYGATRRKHPLLDSGGDLLAAIRRERKMLKPVEAASDLVLDTTSWSPHYLARTIEERYSKDLPPRNLYVTITSFGFKHGDCRQVDNLYDVRFLRNPFFVPELKHKTGLDPAVRDYILEDKTAQEFRGHLEQLSRFLLPQYYREGKHYLRIGIGCTGGKHRSVCMAEDLANKLSENPIDHVVVNVVHRDIDQL